MMDLQQQYKEETGEEVMSPALCASPCRGESPIDVDFFNDSYVWWLEEKIESLQKGT